MLLPLQRMLWKVKKTCKLLPGLLDFLYRLVGNYGLWCLVLLELFLNRKEKDYSCKYIAFYKLF